MSSQASSIPDFIDDYFLPSGIYECKLEEVEQRFAYNEVRKEKWKQFLRLMDRLIELKLKPDAILLDGSFVTKRDAPGDVDFVAYIPFETSRSAMQTTDQHNKNGINILLNKNNQMAIRDLLGVHLLLAPTEESFNSWATFFQQVRDLDPKRDPSWVKKPNKKGIIKITFKQQKGAHNNA
ncbi:DUF6932 family protein [Sporolactobacillus pectinivorans]|uniref:DUF6932 family protein n=1 Tax=Sporolactobacillus pectinivorans TaxID=1591408 RepID=UPI000C25AF4B|nr:hypothetical protein [Sporolactobacillus pectinivorans]